MITPEVINRGGSKLEITRALIESGADIPIPRSTWKYYGQNLDSILPEFERMKKPVIVRGSHKNDYQGFIDVIPTIKDVHNIRQLEDAVKYIEQIMLIPDVKVHCEDWKQDYTPEVHILLQEQSPSSSIGSMIRHPHTRRVHIEYMNLGNSNKKYANVTENGEIENNILSESEEKIKQMVDIYKKLEATGLLNETYSHHVEFGIDPLSFFQARAFKKYEPAKDFEIPDSEYEVTIHSRECFGITPPEGISLPFFCSHYEINPQKADITQPYGLVVYGRFEESPPRGIKFGNIMAFCSPHTDAGYLFHGNYRMMKKSRFSLSDRASLGLEFHRCKFLFAEQGEEFRVFSNGEHMKVIPLRYL